MERLAAAATRGACSCRKLERVRYQASKDRRRRLNRTRVDEPGEAHARDVARLRVDAVEVPDGLGGLREVVRQEAAWQQAPRGIRP